MKNPYFHNHDGHNQRLRFRVRATVAFKQAAIKGLYEGKPLTGENGLFVPLLKHFLESALEGEMDGHLVQTRQAEQNRRNGKATKTVKSSAGLLDLTTPRDRSGTYQPQIVPKRQVVLTPQLEQKRGRPCGVIALQRRQQLCRHRTTPPGDVRLLALRQ